MALIIDTPQWAKDQLPKGRKGGKAANLPFGSIDVGKSLFVHKDDGIVYNALVSAAHRYAKKHGVKFSVRFAADGFIVQRMDNGKVD